MVCCLITILLECSFAICLSFVCMFGLFLICGVWVLLLCLLGFFVCFVFFSWFGFSGLLILFIVDYFGYEFGYLFVCLICCVV